MNSLSKEMENYRNKLRTLAKELAKLDKDNLFFLQQLLGQGFFGADLLETMNSLGIIGQYRKAGKLKLQGKKNE